MSDTEQQAKATTPEDIVMEEEDDAPVATNDQDVVPATDEEPAAAEPEAMETEDKPAANEKPNEKPASSKTKSKAGQSSRKESATGGRKMGGKFAKADAKEANKGKYKVGDLCLGRVKGFPFWPCYVVDPETVPVHVLRQKPRSTSITCVQYFPTTEYSWLSPSDIKPLPKHEIDAYLKAYANKKTDGKLFAAYTLAADPEDFISEQEELRQHPDGVVEKAEDEDELADDDEEEPEVKPGDKRKRAPADKKPTKKETASKRAKTTEKAPSKRSTKKEAAAEDGEEPVSKKASTSKAAANKKAPASTGKKAAAPTSAAKESKESKEAKEDAGDEALANDPEATKVRDWRHKLQRAFLSKSVPSAEEMDNYDKLFSTIENYQNMTVAYLAHSKIGKVMKKIAALTNIPRNDDLKITDRAHSLMQKWTDQIDGKPAETVGNGDVVTDSKAEETVEAEDKTKDASAAEEAPAEEKMEVDEKEPNAEESADKEEAAPVEA